MPRLAWAAAVVLSLYACAPSCAQTTPTPTPTPAPTTGGCPGDCDGKAEGSPCTASKPCDGTCESQGGSFLTCVIGPHTHDDPPPVYPGPWIACYQLGEQGMNICTCCDTPQHAAGFFKALKYKSWPGEFFQLTSEAACFDYCAFATGNPTHFCDPSGQYACDQRPVPLAIEEAVTEPSPSTEVDMPAARRLQGGLPVSERIELWGCVSSKYPTSKCSSDSGGAFAPGDVQAVVNAIANAADPLPKVCTSGPQGACMARNGGCCNTTVFGCADKAAPENGKQLCGASDACGSAASQSYQNCCDWFSELSHCT